MKVSVVVTAYNEAKALPACIKALAEQETNFQYEVIVVDNASTDQTRAVADSWKDKLNMRTVFEAKKGGGSARRKGFSKTRADIILSTDADSVVPTNWIESLAGTLVSHPEVVAVSGSSYITDRTKITNWTMKVGMPASLRIYRLLIGHYMLTGANFAIRKKAYEAAGDFDASRNILDDVDLAFRVSKVGRIMYLKQPKVLTEGDMFRRSYLKGFWHYARHLSPILNRYWFVATQ